MLSLQVYYFTVTIKPAKDKGLMQQLLHKYKKHGAFAVLFVAA